jgi:hypothetical protein
MSPELDDKEKSEISPDLSPEKTDDLPAGEGSDNNDGELEKIRKERDSYKQALKIEREKGQKKGMQVEPPVEHKSAELDEDTFSKLYNERRSKELQDERVEYEEEIKKEIVKKFPSLKAENSFGIKDEVIEAYNDLLEGRVKRGLFPRTKNAISDLVTKAVKIVHPEFFVKGNTGTDYEGSGVAEGVLPSEVNKPKLNEKEKSLHKFIEDSGYKDKK